MRVRISYGVELEDVAEQASNIGYNALLELKHCVRVLEKNLDYIDEAENDYSSVVLAIENIRLKLTKADAILVDTNAILEGLQNYHNGEENVPERRSTMDSGRNTNDEV